MRHVPTQYLKSGAVALTFACSPPSLQATPSAGGDGATTEPHHSGDEGSDVETNEHRNARSNSRHPLLDDRQPQPDASLPRLTYRHLGMHIGGESNSAEAKRPWLDDIERHENELLSCYRWVSDPRAGGSYGVDLYVTSQGGPPEVRGSRQKLGGQAFDLCMRRTFLSIDFHQPERPTVFSYSIFFELEE